MGHAHTTQEPKLCCAALQVFGRMNKTIEGVPVEEGASYVNKYFLLPTDTKSTDTITLSLDDGELEEGYYHMSAKVRAQTAALRLSTTYKRQATHGQPRTRVCMCVELIVAWSRLTPCLCAAGGRDLQVPRPCGPARASQDQSNRH